MLGGPVPFKHCRRTNDRLPCAKVLECWQNQFDVILFLKTNYSEDELKTAFSPQPGRMERIYDLLEKFSGK